MKQSISVPTVLDKEAQLPTYGSKEAAGADIRAHIQKEITLNPGEIKLIPTGLRFAIPEGYEIQIRPRSGLAIKHGVTVLNAPGTIDSDYRGEVGVILINHGKEPFTITPKMRIAQVIFTPVYRANFIAKETLITTERGEGGFGHTGTH